jgi:hypothetical protein
VVVPGLALPGLIVLRMAVPGVVLVSLIWWLHESYTSLGY